ncbi:hypothetical protein [Umezawaea tangerina]|uniref:Uncharacterized protein n=1 Tax=Umezawaea tangerina TaxID=84725 RepID=A0A2T0T4E1_9PSEU|nr:hypothetical protein [Umezawaea tangerina]PRY40501.1 hypothetical protein CLV43_106237 [Umezawaea tangerina]
MSEAWFADSIGLQTRDGQSEDNAWRRRLLDLVSRRLGRDPSASFNAVVKVAKGADPILVQAMLRELAATASPRVRARAREVLANAGQQTALLSAVCGEGLPAPHPLDYEWRFTRRTRDDLVSSAFARASRSVLLLGCPTVALTLLARSPDLRTTLVDDNPALPVLSDLVPRETANYTQLRADLIARPNVTADLEVDVVIADAPFYPEAMTGFLAAAVNGARRGATVLFVLPPFGTRPSAESDVRDFFRLATASGLRHEATLTNGVRYVRPPFEANAHRAAGLLSVADDWRAADLAVFRLTSRAAPTKAPLESERARWREVVVGGKRWRVKTNSGDADAVEGLLQPIAANSVLDSVSRRDQRRHQANVCTDANEFFITSNPDLLLEVLASINTGLNPAAQGEKLLGRTFGFTEYVEVTVAHDMITRGAGAETELG